VQPLPLRLLPKLKESGCTDYASVSFADFLVGMLLDKLDELKRTDDTVIGLIGAGVGYTYDLGGCGTTISAIFRPFSAVFGAFSPSWRQEAGQREKTAKERWKKGQKRGRNRRI